MTFGLTFDLGVHLGVQVIFQVLQMIGLTINLGFIWRSKLSVRFTNNKCVMSPILQEKVHNTISCLFKVYVDEREVLLDLMSLKGGSPKT